MRDRPSSDPSLVTPLSHRYPSISRWSRRFWPSRRLLSVCNLPRFALLESAEREPNGVAGAPYNLADPLSKITHQYDAIVIDTRLSFSFITEIALLAATDAIILVEPRYQETIGMMSVLQKINAVRED